jgi:hypothetical protein
MSIEKLDVFCVHSSTLEGKVHCPGRSPTGFMPGCDVVSVRCETISGDFSDNLRTASDGVVKSFDDDDTSALAHNESISTHIKRARRSRRFLIEPRRKYPSGSTAGQTDGVAGCCRPATHTTPRHTKRDPADAVANGLQARHASSRGRTDQSFKAIPDGNMSRGHIDQ